MDNKAKYAKKLKEARQNAGLTQLDVASIIKRPQQTLAAWETGRSQPDANTLAKLLQIYKVSPNVFFEYNEYDAHLNSTEKEHIKKYRALDESGKETVDFILDKEYARAMDSQHVQEMVNQASSFEDQNNTIRLSNIKHTGKTQTVRIASRNGPSTLTLNEEQLKAARELVKKLQENPEDDIDDDLV